MPYPRFVYVIKHNITNRVYVGSSHNVKHRYLRHMYLLRKGKHKSKLMQKDFDEYGENYSLSIVDRISGYGDSYKEYQQMVVHKSFCPKYGYNQGDLKSHNALTAKRHLKPKVYEDLNNYSDTKGDLIRKKELEKLETIKKFKKEAKRKAKRKARNNF